MKKETTQWHHMGEPSPYIGVKGAPFDPPNIRMASMKVLP